ncbi:Pv-fam-h protein [Plasmodium cynomolgi strain B]|uniref:Pv-fam-h protein n=1 Tax=Plasmodium cynomolgi (strain B) TaxID=1120755 RepID=K6UUR0_PLACD|nr:Pv-fam-h protein [Plasmodium cynomolgi strain B]GAB65950.1 Pv-fam-h protein [Plasmodium cynomolgi strain B]
MVEVTFSKLSEDTYLESAKNAVLSFRRENENASKTGGIIRDKIGSFTLFKVLMFFLLIWIIRCSGEDAIHEVKSDRGIPQCLYGYRLLAESEVQFDAIFDLYKKNFLNKMGYTDEDSERIKTTVKSHLDQTKGMDTDQQRRKKLEACEHIIKQGSDNNISKFSNNFRVLSSPYFLVLSSFILFSNGYYRFFLALMGILILKFVNFFWDLKYVISRMAESM